VLLVPVVWELTWALWEAKVFLAVLLCLVAVLVLMEMLPLETGLRVVGVVQKL
jgi:hypothetical protein